jgi:hypothetical protein
MNDFDLGERLGIWGSNGLLNLCVPRQTRFFVMASLKVTVGRGRSLSRDKMEIH